MNLLRVDRSPIRLFLFGIVGLIMMIGAVDIMWGHWLSTPPDTYNGEISSKGKNQRRADYVWGGFLLIGGAGLFGYSVTTLIRRKPVIVVRDDGMVIGVGPPGEETIFVPWDVVETVQCAVEKDPDDGPDRDVLAIEFSDSTGLPAEPWGAYWDGDRLIVDAVGWDTPIEEISIHAETAIEHAHRSESKEVSDGD